MSYLPGEVKENLGTLSRSLAELSKHLAPLQQFQSMPAINTHLSPADSLKLNAAIAYSLNSLYYILLKLQGENVSSHPIIKDIESVKGIVYKVQQALYLN